MTKKESEFGKGFIYNLILFAKHWMFMHEELLRLEKSGIKSSWSIWFSGASDHLYELEIPKQWKDKEIGKLAKWLQDRCLYLGHTGFFIKKATEKDFTEVFEKLEKLGMLIDKELGVEVIKAGWN